MPSRALVWAQMAAVTAPLATVLIIRATTAPAAGVPVREPSAAVVVPVMDEDGREPTPREAALLRWLAELEPLREDESPLGEPVAAAATPEPITDVPAPAAPTVDPLAGLRLTAILQRQGGGVAVISGRLYQVGEEVRAGCRVLAVDARAQEVRVALSDGTVVTLRCAR